MSYRSAPQPDPPSMLLDIRGYKCPVPVIKTEQRLRALARELREGGGLYVIADDPLAAIDIPHFCHQFGLRIHRLDELKEAITKPGDILFRISLDGSYA